ncbi:hypothetical protein LZ30DRAFT_728600 [Colletotrichum cereale]|nr:hypothetical protein LZ30DRAFT_728600 [Colletotrichum cereale]
MKDSSRVFVCVCACVLTGAPATSPDGRKTWEIYKYKHWTISGIEKVRGLRSGGYGWFVSLCSTVRISGQFQARHSRFSFISRTSQVPF